MADAVFHYGNVVDTIPYTPSGADVAAGEVVVINDITGISTRKIPDGQLGALNVLGGVYIVKGDAAIAAGKVVYWNNTTNQITETATGNKRFGVTVTACSGAAAECDAEHRPG